MPEFTGPVAWQIREAAGRGALSHALLFTGPGDRMSAARWAAAAMECQGDRPPCGVCPACRKVLSEIHPDVITVQDSDHKFVSVDMLRESVRADAHVRPNEGRRKVYLFPDCALLTDKDQNLLLKLVEEGPAYAAFLFCAENASVVLRTLRSRCVELKLPPPAERGGTESEAGEALCRAMASGKKGAVAELAVRLERKRSLSREDLAESLAWARRAFSAALLVLYGCGVEESDREIASILAKTLTKAQIMSTIETLETYHGDCAYNVGVGHVLGALAAELEGIL